MSGKRHIALDNVGMLSSLKSCSPSGPVATKGGQIKLFIPDEMLYQK